MVNLINNTSTIAIAEIRPNIPISLAIASSFYCNGVAEISPPLNRTLIRPRLEFSPTTITTNKPSPVRIYELNLYKFIVPLFLREELEKVFHGIKHPFLLLLTELNSVYQSNIL